MKQISTLILFLGSTLLFANNSNPLPPGSEADAGPDVVICSADDDAILQGQIIGDFLSFQWIPEDGLSNPNSLTPTVSGNNFSSSYTLLVESLSTDNLITNGDFEAFDVGFTSDHTYTAGDVGGMCQGCFNINDQTPTLWTSCAPNDGNMMIFNAHLVADQSLWCQTVNVLAGFDYAFSTQVMTINSPGPIIDVQINDISIGIIGAGSSCQWMEQTANWFSGSATTAEICLINNNLAAGGNDFALDDLVFSAVCRTTDEVSVSVLDLQANTNTEAQLSCNPDLPFVELDGEGSSVGSNISYLWTTNDGNIVLGETTLNPFVDAPGTYTLNVIYDDGDNSCTETAEVLVTQQAPPVAAANSFTDISCYFPEVTLSSEGSSSGPNIEYFWYTTDGNFVSDVTSFEAIVDEPGFYFLAVTDFVNGCTTETSVFVGEFPPPNADIFPDGPTEFCQGQSVQLFASGGDTYDWTGPNGFVAIGATITADMDGVYTVTANTGVCAIDVSQTITITGEATASITADGPTTICSGESVGLTASAGSNYSWAGPDGFVSSQPNISATMAGTYTVVLTDDDGCTASASEEITIADDLDVTISPDGSTALCEGESVTLTGAGGDSYNWMGPDGFTADTPSITVSDAGIYTLLATNDNGCSGDAVLEVQANPSVDAAISASGSTSLCPGDEVTFIASGGDSYLWSGPNEFSADTESITVGTAGNYSVIITNAEGCTGTTSEDVVVNDGVIADITADGPTEICEGSAVILTATGGTSYSWTGPNSFTANGASISADMEGTYVVVVTNDASCTGTASQEIIISDSLPAEINADGSTALCAGETVTLTGTGGDNYNWTGPNEFSADSQTITISTEGTYSLIVTNLAGCTGQTSQIITANPAVNAAITASGTTTLCPGDEVTLMANEGEQFSWIGPDGFTASSQDITVSAAGTYTVEITNIEGCSDMATETIVITDEITAGIVADGNTAFCEGESVVLTGTGGTSYSWVGPNGFVSDTSTIVVNAAGEYTLSAFSGSCSAQTAENIVVYDNPIALIDVIGENEICKEDSAQLVVSGGVTFEWNGPAGYIGDSSTIWVVFTGDYIATVYSAEGCADMDTTSIIVHPNPFANIDIQDDNLLCVGDSTVLSVEGNDSYFWEGPNNFTSEADSIVVNTEGTYTLTATNTTGCTGTAEEMISVFDYPTATIDAEDTICEGSSATLTATGGTIYNWEGPGGFMSDSSTISVVADGTYNVTVSNIASCDDQTTHTLMLLPAGDASIMALGDTAICVGSSTTLVAMTENPFIWILPNGETSEADSITITSGGTYILSATNDNGCVRVVSQVINVEDIPVAMISGEDVVCEGSSTVLTSSGGNTYLWEGPNDFTSSSNMVNATIPGLYTVTVFNAVGCSDQVSHTVAALSLPEVNITASGATDFCEGETVELTASGANEYFWTGPDGFQTQETTIEIAHPGVYEVMVEGENGCTNTASEEITVYAYPVGEITVSDSTICDNESATLTASGAVSYNWTGPDGFMASGPSINVETAGVYVATFIGEGGCSNELSEMLTVNPTPELNIIADGPTTFCDGLSVGLTGEGAVDYSWVTPNGTLFIQASIDALEHGTYLLTGINEFGCSSEALQDIIIIAPPAIAGISGEEAPDVGSLETYDVVTPNVNSSYNWEVTGGIIISGQGTANASIEWGGDMAGQVCVTETNEQGCISEVLCLDIMLMPNHTYDLEDWQLQISPNPTANFINIEGSTDLIFEQVELFNIVGQKIITAHPGLTNQHQISLYHLPAGTYLLIVATNNGNAAKRIIKL